MKKQILKPVVDIDLDKYALFQEKETGVHYLVEINEINQKYNTENIIYKCYPTTNNPENGRVIIRLNDNGLTFDIPKENLHSVLIDLTPR